MIFAELTKSSPRFPLKLNMLLHAKFNMWGNMKAQKNRKKQTKAQMIVCINEHSKIAAMLNCFFSSLSKRIDWKQGNNTSITAYCLYQHYESILCKCSIKMDHQHNGPVHILHIGINSINNKTTTTTA